MKKFTMLFVCLLLISVQLAHAQKRSITGTVTSSEDGMPLPGVTVSIKGTTIGTITDIDGKYNLEITESTQSLVYSFVGMKTKEVIYGANNVIDVILEPDVVGVDEVVVTALGIKKSQKALGYSVQQIKSDDLNQGANTDLSHALQGKVSGVDIKVSSGMPGASSQINIRGVRSFTGNNQPLYVIDGMPIDNQAPYSTLNSVDGTDVANRAVDINPNDIESINILKGQAAAALYGIRASNGVIVITTKSGKGGPKGKTVVSISQNTSFDKVSRTPDYQTVYSQGSGGTYNPTTSMSWGGKITDLPNDATYGGNNNGHPGLYFVPQRETGGLDPWVAPQVYNNWDDYYTTGINSTTNINVSKATEEGNFSMGVGYTNQDGVAINTGMQRWNAKFLAERKLNKHFSTGFSGNYINLNIDKLSGANDGSLAGVLSAPSSYNLKGNPFSEPGDPYSQIYYRSLTFDNPYWVQYNNTFNEKTDRFFGNGHVDFNADLASDMTIAVKYQLGIDSYTTHYQDIFGFGSNGGAGKIQNRGATQSTVNSLLTIIYDWKIMDDLGFNLMLGNEFNHANIKNYEQNGANFNYGGWNNIANSEIMTGIEEKYQDRTVGSFYSASFDYKDMVFINTTGRRDVVSTMPNGNRTFFYPSVSSSILLSEINTLKSLDWLSFAKVRASYAEVGQAGTYYENYYDTPDYEGSWWKGEPIIYPLDGVSSYTPYPIQYDPNLKPQNTKSYELGFEVKFLQNRVGLDYTYSTQNTVDQIFKVPLAGSSGVSDLVMNAGNIKTDAHELSLYLVPVKTEDFTWDVSLNYSKIESEVMRLAEGVESIFLGGFTTPQVRAGIGYTFPVIYGNSYERDDQGRILVNENPLDSDYGMPKAGKDKVIGSASPDFILGWTTSFTYKDISLGAVFEWKNGGQMYSGSNGLLDLYGMSERTQDRESTFVYAGYKADGTPNDIVRGGADDPDAYQVLYSNVLSNIDESYIYGNSFVKLREISLKYHIPKTLLSKVDLSVSAFARNILLWTELPNLDPESSQGNGNMMGSFERFSMPQTQSFGFGIEVKF